MRAFFRSGAVVAQVTVNHLVAGSNPAFGANLARHWRAFYLRKPGVAQKVLAFLGRSVLLCALTEGKAEGFPSIFQTNAKDIDHAEHQECR